MPNVGSVSVELQHIPRATLDVPPSELFTVAPRPGFPAEELEGVLLRSAFPAGPLGRVGLPAERRDDRRSRFRSGEIDEQAGHDE